MCVWARESVQGVCEKECRLCAYSNVCERERVQGVSVCEREKVMCVLEREREYSCGVCVSVCTQE